MKKRILLVVLLFNLIESTDASHIAGGTIGYECLSNGQYRFTMELYRDCVGIDLGYQDETLYISGAPLPTDNLGNPIQTIMIKPDSARWQLNNNGDLSPQCKGGNGWTCTSGFGGQEGPKQVFWYTSDSITLNGVPPTSGWTFSWQAPPARSNDIDNLQSTSGLFTRALQVQMFPFNNQNTNPCFDSSPVFNGNRNSTICRAYIFTYNQTVEDNDLDSLVYVKSPVFNQAQGSFTAPLVPVPFQAPFTLDSPTPTATQNANNIPYSLDSLTGNTRLAIYSGNGVQKFATGVRVDAYREGQKISSTYRERNLSVFACSSLQNGLSNNAPQSFVNGTATTNRTINVSAGQLVQLPLQFLDNDDGGNQTITVIPKGNLFTVDKGPNVNALNGTARQKGAPCALPGVAPCAYLENTSPSLDTFQTPAVQSIRGVGNVQSQFVWQTDCNNLKADGSAQSYNFYLNAFDDHCPVPYFKSVAIRINVLPNVAAIQPQLDCIQQESNGRIIHWNNNIGQLAGFQSLEIYKSIGGSSNFSLLQSITDSTQVSYFDGTNTAQSAAYYVQVNGQNCNGSIGLSQPSDTLSAEPFQLNVVNSAHCFQLTWNSNNVSLRDQDRYIIYREFPIGTGLVKIDSIFNDTMYCDVLVNCSDSVNYRVIRESFSQVCDAESNVAGASGSNYNSNASIKLDDRTFSVLNLQGNVMWYSCSKDSLFVNATDTSFSPQDSGSYAAIVTQFGCRDTSNCIPLFAVGLEENTLQNNTSLFPNPNTGVFNLKGLELGEQYKLSIRNLQGQLIQEELIVSAEQVELVLKGKAGIYFVQLKNRRGDQANLKVVKQ